MGQEQPTGPKLAGEVNQGGGEEDLPEGDVREEQHGYAEGGGDQGDQEEAHSQEADTEEAGQIDSESRSPHGGLQILLGPAVAFAGTILATAWVGSRRW